MILLSVVILLTKYSSLSILCVFQRHYITNPENQKEEKLKRKRYGKLEEPWGSICNMPICTRQPVAGFGGVKLGEMERECLIVRLRTCTSASSLSVISLKCISGRNAKNVANVIQLAMPCGRKIRGPYCQELFSMGIILQGWYDLISSAKLIYCASYTVYPLRDQLSFGHEPCNDDGPGA
ncbi:hypothetical protein SADUNF_Sadunf06G0212800 [Salix dunnii]|uniref:Uncharacterized protein n=1 Tax=Salix dunnii TaxID=1413687 RepID=A0A835K5T0_9ROSI|nr:hypothetical protein SADUNF_Sadunf06G0212800 [Salix dunnii]